MTKWLQPGADKIKVKSAKVVRHEKMFRLLRLYCFNCTWKSPGLVSSCRSTEEHCSICTMYLYYFYYGAIYFSPVILKQRLALVGRKEFNVNLRMMHIQYPIVVNVTAMQKSHSDRSRAL